MSKSFSQAKGGDIGLEGHARGEREAGAFKEGADGGTNGTSTARVAK